MVERWIHVDLKRFRIEIVVLSAVLVTLTTLVLTLIIAPYAHLSASETVIVPFATTTDTTEATTPVEAPTADQAEVAAPLDTTEMAASLDLPSIGTEEAQLAEMQEAPNMPTDAPTVTASDTPTTTVALAEAATATPATGSEVRLVGIGEVAQTLNNCGPASVSMVLTYYGVNVSQEKAQAVLRPDPDEWGMLPDLVPPYVANFHLESRVLDHGTDDDIKALVDQGIPVIVAQWLSEANPVPHYRVVIGYNDEQQAFIVNDGVLGFGQYIAYADFDGLWDVYANLYLPIFRPEAADQVQATLGDQWNHTVKYVTLVHSRPEWDALLAVGGPNATPTADEAAEVTATLEPTATLTPNTSAETASPLTPGETQTGLLAGSTGGAFAYYTVKVEHGGDLQLTYTPDNAGVASGMGLKVYRVDGKVIGEAVNTTGKVGERHVALPTIAGTYTVQVYNYLPNLTLDFSLTWK